MQINDHVFIVMGASSGIGLATAEALTDDGGAQYFATDYLRTLAGA